MAKNGLLERVEIARRLGREEGLEIESQFMADVACVVLHQEFGFGQERMRKFISELSKAHDEYESVFRVKKDNPECDYLRVALDRILQECIPPEEFVPFNDRYPKIKEVKY